jgi:uncharacterized protein with HEPN domain
MRRDDDRLRDILTAIDRITRETRSGRSSFDADEKTRVWVIYHLQMIGEAAGRLSDDTRQSSPLIPWARIVGMRNILVHHYFEIDDEEVWATVERDLSDLRANVAALLSSRK